LKYLNAADEEDPKDLNFMSKTNLQYSLLENCLPPDGYKIDDGIDRSEYIPYNMLLFL